MTFEDKAEIVIAQLRADRDRLQNAIKQIRGEINELSYPYNVDAIRVKADVLRIIDRYTKGE